MPLTVVSIEPKRSKNKGNRLDMFGSAARFIQANKFYQIIKEQNSTLFLVQQWLAI